MLPASTPHPLGEAETAAAGVTTIAAAPASSADVRRRTLPTHEAASVLDASSGRILDRFVLLEVLGQGGMGIVYKAYDPVLRREVALKFLRPDTVDADAGPELVAEAQAMARLSHANVVAVYDVMMAGEHVVVAMEYVAGQTLRRWLTPVAGTAPKWPRVLEVFTAAGRGLAAAHEAGLVHRDFKPSNVLVSDEQRILVTDFGLASRRRETSDDELGASERAAHRDIAGTPTYMPPEQHTGADVDPRADQYSFCVALWEALCGAPPFTGHGLDALERAKRRGPPRWPKTARVPRHVVAAIERGLAPERDDRWPTMQALLQALAYRSLASRRAVTAGALALPITATWLMVERSEQADRCSGAVAQLSETWNEKRRDAIQASMLGTGVHYAPRTWELVSTALDAYAHGWMEAHRAACEASVIDGTQPEAVMDLRMACLHRHKTELGSAAEVLERADDAVVERAVQIVAALPSLSRCSDVDALTAEVPPPEDPQDAAAVEVARGHLAEARLLEKAGRYAAAREQLDAAREQIDGIAYAPAHAELQFVQGLLLEREGDFARSERALEQSLTRSLTSGSLELAARAAGLLALVRATQTRFEGSLRLTQMAIGFAHGQNDRGEVESFLREAAGRVLFQQGRYREAEAEYRLAQRLHENVRGPEHPETALNRSNLGRTLAEQGRYDEAEAEYRHALALLERTFGPEHPRIATTRSALGGLLQEQGRHREAEQELRLALLLEEKNHGPDSIWVAQVRNNLGLVLQSLHRNEEAEAEHRAALAVRQKALPEDHPMVADSRMNLALLLLAGGQLDEAEALLRAARASFERSLGADHARIGIISYNLAQAFYAAGRDAEAEREFARAVMVSEKALGSEHPHVAIFRAALGQTVARRGRDDDARLHLERALAVAVLPPGVRAYVAFTLADVLWRSPAERPRALELAQAALRDYQVDGGTCAGDCQEVQTWLAARKHIRVGRTSSAR